jgi:hypothetical protein
MSEQGKVVSMAEKRLERLRNVREAIYEKAAAVVGLATIAADYDPENEEPITAAEVEEAGGPRKAAARRRIMRDMHKPGGEAPVYLAINERICKNYERILMAEKAGTQNNLNIAVFMQNKESDPTISRNDYEAIDITPEGDE